MTKASDYRVESIRHFVDLGQYAATMSWSPDGEWIAYDFTGADGYVDVHRMRVDGTGDECLTCDVAGLPSKHNGSPRYHPSGRYVVFQGEKAEHDSDDDKRLGRPGAGVFCDLWVIDLETRQAFRLTDVRSKWPGGGSLMPRFSEDGSKLVWSDWTGESGKDYGAWQLAVADFVVSPEPKLENVAYYRPLPGKWYESHGFGPDNSWIYFTGVPLEGMDANGMDIVRMDLATQHVTRLTMTSGIGGEDGAWDEHAELSPRGDVMVWISSRGYPFNSGSRDLFSWLAADVWIMNADGSGQRQLTHFNDDGYPESQGRSICSTISWAPDGRQFAVTVAGIAKGNGEIMIVRLSNGRD